MRLSRILTGEIMFRRVSFCLGCFSVGLAVAAAAGSVALLRGHDLRTERVVELKEAQTRAEMARMEDDYRRIMKRMGYNLMVLNKTQDAGKLLEQGYPETTISEAYAERLAAVGLDSLNHLLPVLQKRVIWPETGESILLTGIRGQMHLAGPRSSRSPIMAPVPDGRVALGRALSRKVNAVAGEEITFMGERFIVERVEPARGTAEDMALWVSLARVQEWLGMPGQISGILALECVCHAGEDGSTAAEVSALLPDTQVFEFTSRMRGRAEARQRAAETRRKAIEEEREQRARLRGERARLALFMAPLLVFGGGLLVFVLAFGNARDRRGEIGLLRAVGVGRGQVLALFLGKAALMGIVGGVLGLAGAILAGAAAAGVRPCTGPALGLLGLKGIIGALLMGPLLGCVAALLPAWQAARQDPADVLREE